MELAAQRRRTFARSQASGYRPRVEIEAPKYGAIAEQLHESGETLKTGEVLAAVA
jgi:hypothetical protein